jgi:HNH endonuclease
MLCQTYLKRHESLEALRQVVKQLLLEKTVRKVVDLEIQNECIVWNGARDRDGYGRVYLPKTNSFDWKVHRVVWSLYWQKEIPEGLWLLHQCDNPPCCNPYHFRLGTNTENTLERDIRGRTAKMYGLKNPQTKLTDEQVREIRLLRQRGFLQREIAEKFNVKSCYISEILSGKKRAMVL